MNFVKQMILQEERRKYLDKRKLWLSVKDKRPIRWELKLELEEENQEENEMQKLGFFDKIKQKLTNCTNTDEDLDFNSIDLMKYFTKLEQEMQLKLNTEKKAIKNW